MTDKLVNVHFAFNYNKSEQIRSFKITVNAKSQIKDLLLNTNELINSMFEEESIDLFLKPNLIDLIFKPSKRSRKPDFDYPSIYYLFIIRSGS